MDRLLPNWENSDAVAAVTSTLEVDETIAAGRLKKGRVYHVMHTIRAWFPILAAVGVIAVMGVAHHVFGWRGDLAFIILLFVLAGVLRLCAPRANPYAGGHRNAKRPST